ncbi:MAG: hypothetical protein WC637_04425 [Victivallales bacterium]|jgi:hypothetical protein
MNKYEILAVLVLSLFLIPIGYVVYVIISIIRSPKLQIPPIENEPWTYGGQQLTISYRKGARPDQKIIDEVKDNINQYEKLIAEYAEETEGYKKNEFKTGLSLSGISYPLNDEEKEEYDFSIDYQFEDNSDMVLEAYIKNGKVLRILSGD